MDLAVVNLATMDQKVVFSEIEGHQGDDARTPELLDADLTGAGRGPAEKMEVEADTLYLGKGLLQDQ